MTTTSVPIEVAYVICGSHRAREKLARRLDAPLVQYFNLRRGYYLTAIPASAVPDALTITGVRLGKFGDGWLRCWD